MTCTYTCTNIHVCIHIHIIPYMEYPVSSLHIDRQVQKGCGQQ